jgi:FG-GAP-like repeat
MMYRPSMMRQALRPGLLVTLVVLALSACGGDQQSEQGCEAPAEKSASTDPKDLWVDATKTTIGTTYGYTNRVELADINGDDLVDILFANGGTYEVPGKPDYSKVFLNQGPDNMFEGATRKVLPKAMLARVIKVRDVNADGSPDILVGTTFQTQSHLYLGDGSGNFTDVTKTHLPQIKASVGDLEFGDVDGDGDLDVVLADWGKEGPLLGEGGRTMLWLNDGAGHFTNATAERMPNVLVLFSWELEFVDVDNDYDLDVLVSCKVCEGSFLFENDGTGTFTDVTQGRLPQFSNNYDFEAMDVNGDGYLDLATTNDVLYPTLAEHLFLNDGKGGFSNETSRLWPDSENVGSDDAMDTFLDFDSDGDPDLLIGSLDDDLGLPDRLLLNDGTGKLKLVNHTQHILSNTPGTLYIAVADLNGDCRLDVVQAQGEEPGSFREKVYLGDKIQPDTAPPVITEVEKVSASGADRPLQIRARVHDNKSPTMPHDWRSVVLRWRTDGQTHQRSMQWYGEYLWRGMIDKPPAGDFSYEVCATDAAGNKACASP